MGQNNVAAYSTYGTSRANAYKILEDSLNLRDVRIYDTVEDADGKERRVLNAKETTLAAQKQQAIRDAFRDWIWRDPERRQALVRQYNEEMNATRPREYDGSHIVFGGMNPAITLREHQKNAIAHVLYGGNTLLAHEVGAGKTFEMVGGRDGGQTAGAVPKELIRGAQPPDRTVGFGVPASVPVREHPGDNQKGLREAQPQEVLCPYCHRRLRRHHHGSLPVRENPHQQGTPGAAAA